MSDQYTKDVFSIVIFIIAICGVVINIYSIGILIHKKLNSMFHQPLKLMAVYDLIVVIGCSFLYCLPNLWSYYTYSIYPIILPWLLPIVQIAMMSSVYCTIVMSFERYIRICHLCQMRDSSYITQENFRMDPFSNESMIRNITGYSTQLRLEATPMRENVLYYRIYFIGLNTIFASILPLASLLFLNVSTVKALRKMSRQEELLINDVVIQAPPPTKSTNEDTASVSPCRFEFLEVFYKKKISLGIGGRGSTTAYSPGGLWMDPAKRSQENRLTRISLGIVWLFIFCHVWRLIPTIYEGIVGDEKVQKWPSWLEIINHLSHTLIVFNSAVNFLIYATF
ncbi:G-protein coupled receptor daf-37 isoform X2 [Lepeophtheirus salmonis]|uniref:G-protein coupled receptor daf-37 isoform X2 n=1 Tax=Lepeophtheirus salmonis TaxID=72036 RepID=UPI003AF3D168